MRSKKKVHVDEKSFSCVFRGVVKDLCYRIKKCIR